METPGPKSCSIQTPNECQAAVVIVDTASLALTAHAISSGQLHATCGMSFLISSSRYFSRLWPMMLINGHCALLLKKCAQILRTPRLSEADPWSFWRSVSSAKSTTSYASSTTQRTQCSILSSLSVVFLSG